MDHHLSFLIIFILICSGIGGNIWFQSYEINATHGEVDIWTRGRFGYTLVSLQQYEKNITIFVTENSYSHRVDHLSTNFSQSIDQRVVLWTERVGDPQVMGYAANEVQFKVLLPIEMIANTTMIQIGYSAVEATGSLNFDEVLEGNLSNQTRIASFIPLHCYRYEHLHMGGYIPVISIIIIGGVLCILFIRFQPMKSRGLVPIAACLLGLPPHLRLIYVLSPITDVINQRMCLLDELAAYPSSISTICMVVFHFCRYVALTNLNQRKELAAEKKSVIGNKWSMILLKVLGSWYINLLVLFLSLIIWYFLVLWINVGFNFECTARRQTISQYIYFGSLFVIILIFPVAFLIDIYLNFRHIKSCNLSYFWKQDIHWTRFEIYGIGMCIGIPIEIVNILVSLISPNNLVKSIFVSIIYHYLIVLLVIHPLSLTMLTLVYNCFNRKPPVSQIQIMLAHERGYAMVYNQCLLEFSIENISCWKDIIEFKKSPDKSKADEIWKLYLNGASSDLEVNVSNHITTSISSNIKTEYISVHLFDELETQLIMNLSDTFSRLAFTREYKLFKQIEATTMHM